MPEVSNMKKVIPEIKKELSQIFEEKDIYDDPRQIIYLAYTDYILPIDSEYKELVKNGEKFLDSPITSKERSLLNIPYIKKNKIQVYRSYNKRGLHIILKCSENETMYEWNSLKEITSY